MRVRRCAGLALVPVLALSACGGDGESQESLPEVGEESSDGASPSESPSEASASPSEPGAIVTSFPDIGFEIRDLPQVKSTSREALATWATFARGHHVMAHEATFNKMLSENGAGPALAGMRDQVDGLRQKDWHYTGPWVVEVMDFQRKGPSAVVDACVDVSESRLVKKGETQPEPPDGARGIVRANLSHTGAAWKVTGYAPEEGTC